MTNGTKRGWGVSVTPRSLFTPGKDPVLIVQEAGWALGPVWTDAENLAPTGIRSPDRPACSQSLYRLSYPAHLWYIYGFKICNKNGITRHINRNLLTEMPHVTKHSHVFGTDYRRGANTSIKIIKWRGNWREFMVEAFDVFIHGVLDFWTADNVIYVHYKRKNT